MAKKKKLEGVAERFSSENEYWAASAGADIVEVIETETGHEDYTVNRKHLFRLEDDNYAVVQESGCSCYSMADATVVTYETLKEARREYNDIEL